MYLSEEVGYIILHCDMLTATTKNKKKKKKQAQKEEGADVKAWILRLFWPPGPHL